jgi:hypothetical protein
MAWNISAGAIRNPIPPILLILTLVFAGWTAYGRLPINQLPNVVRRLPGWVGKPRRAGNEAQSQRIEAR